MTAGGLATPARALLGPSRFPESRISLYGARHFIDDAQDRSPAVGALARRGGARGPWLSLASTWVHYRILRDPLYSSVCDVNATFSCTEAYTSRFGSVAACPVALIGVLYFAFVLVLIALCRRSATARQNLAGYVFAVSTLGLAGVLYLAYASFCRAQGGLSVVRRHVRGDHRAVPHLGRSGQVSHEHVFPSRVARSRARWFARRPRSAAPWRLSPRPAWPSCSSRLSRSPRRRTATSLTARCTQAARRRRRHLRDAMQQLEQYLRSQPRVPIVARRQRRGGRDHQVQRLSVPAVRQTYREYKPILAKLQQKYPGKIAFITQDFPLDPECNARGGAPPGGV